jgi:class 3 adenylate cyclase/tetratricopeptide (TPR) repeat protein
MRCSKCGSDNRDGRKFCTSCGTPLVAACPKCGAAIQPDERYCGECGIALGDAAPAAAATDSARVVASAGGERRHLTVLFCDLVGSTEIAARLDPEEWRETVAAYHRAAAEAVTRYGGYVAQYLGDGVMAYFGWPEAHENDVERAARAGLAILESISQLNEKPIHTKLAARVGIHSGAVVVGAGVGKEADVFGDVPSIAARVQSLAEPGTVLITKETHRLVSGLFVVEDRGAQAVKGIERPLQLYRVIQPSGLRGRLEAIAATRGVTGFVGRGEELRMLMECWESARDGAGQVVLITGEAGIGKSRLLHRFREQIAGIAHRWIEAAAAPFYQNTPFYPVSEMLRKLILWRDNEQPDDQLPRIENSLELVGLKPADSIPLIAPLLNLTMPIKYPPSTMSPEQQRRRLLALLVEWFVRLTRPQPIVIVTEDLHWADPSTLELIQLMVEQGATVPLLLLYTARPEFCATWPQRGHLTQITLKELSVGEVRAMIAELAAQRALADETVTAIVERAGGVPLFVEELTLAVLENGDAKLVTRGIPVTLRDSLMARLDRLGPAKEAIQLGAVIGSEFSYELLRAMHPVAEEDLRRTVRVLIDAQLIYEDEDAAEPTYKFKHALIRDLAYEALLKTRRREAHQRVVHVIEERFAQIIESQPEVVAHHCAEAGLTTAGARYWRKAGQKAIERSAHKEAMAHLNRGLELVATLPQGEERATEELQLQVALTTPLTAMLGATAPEVERACNQARELLQVVGDTRARFSVLGMLFPLFVDRGDAVTAHELAEQMLGLASQRQSPVWLLWAHLALGVSLMELGDLIPARTHLERAAQLYVPGRHSYGFVEDPGATSTSRLAYVLVCLGYPDQALRRSEEAFAQARELSQPYTLAMVLGHAGLVRLLRGELWAAQDLIKRMVTICEEQGFALLEAIGNNWLGRVLVAQGRINEGISLIYDSLGRYAAMDNKVDIKFERFTLASAHRRLGQPEEGLAELELVQAMIAKTAKHILQSQVYQLKGELLLMLDPSKESEAEQNFRLAIETARKQNAKATELTATTSLARLLRNTSHRDEAHSMLADIYNWFTEGFDTADLKEAKALLEELAT